MPMLSRLLPRPSAASQLTSLPRLLLASPRFSNRTGYIFSSFKNDIQNVPTTRSISSSSRNPAAATTAEIRDNESAQDQVGRKIRSLGFQVYTKRSEFPAHLKASGVGSIGLVPTMGALHGGHLQLIEAAAKENDTVVVSIYVNPTQFGVNEDLSSYPRTLESDLDQLQELITKLAEEDVKAADLVVFVPTTQYMYPNLPPSSEIDGQGSFVTITPIGGLLEGASRPVFFRGVATVCMKLFNLVRPTRVYFGQKDIQQTAIIQRLLRDFHFDTTLRIIPTMRDPDGLAQSSRNVFLGTRRRAIAPVMHDGLMLAEKAMKEGNKRSREDILGPAREHILEQAKFQECLTPDKRARIGLDYISLADWNTMEEIDVVEEEQRVVVSAALKMMPVEEPGPEEETGEGDGGSRTIRLIDNIVFNTSQRDSIANTGHVVGES